MFKPKVSNAPAAPTAPTPPPEVRELTRAGKLPDSRLRPITCGWARSEMLTFNHYDLPPFTTIMRLRERESIVFGSERVLLSVSVQDYGFCGAVCVTVIDFAERRERSTTKILPFSMGHLELPKTAESGDVLYRSDDLSLDFLRAPGKRYIRLRVDHFDDVRQLYANVVLEDAPGDAAFSIAPLGKKSKRFLLRHGMYSFAASGQIVLGADVYELLPEETTGWLERERSDGGSMTKHSRLTVSGRCGEETFALCVSDGGVFAAENTVIIGGRAQRLENAKLEREDGVWYVSTPDGRMQLYVPVVGSRLERMSMFGLSSERQREYGLAFGEMTVCGERRVLTDALGCGETVMSKC